MPRITVTALPDEEGTDATSPVLLDERIGSIHLGDDYAATAEALIDAISTRAPTPMVDDSATLRR